MVKDKSVTRSQVSDVQASVVSLYLFGVYPNEHREASLPRISRSTVRSRGRDSDPLGALACGQGHTHKDLFNILRTS